MDNHIDGSDENNHMIISYYPITICLVIYGGYSYGYNYVISIHYDCMIVYWIG